MKNRPFVTKRPPKNLVKYKMLLQTIIIISLLVNPTIQNVFFGLDSYLDQNQVCVAPTPDGNFVLIFECKGYGNNTVDHHICSQKINPLNSNKIIDSRFAARSSPFDQLTCAVLSNGYIVVVFHDASVDDLYYMSRTSDLGVVTLETMLNFYTTGSQAAPFILPLLNSNFIILFHSTNYDGSEYGIVGKMFSNSVSVTKNDFVINTSNLYSQMYPCGCVLSNGNFIVAWQSNHNTVYPGNKIYFQMFDTASNYIAGETLANSANLNDDMATPSITCMTNDNFIIAWVNNSNRDGNGRGIYARVFDENRNAVSSDFLINTTTNYNQVNIMVESMNIGGFVAVWNSDYSNNVEYNDTSGWGVWMQRFDSSLAKVGSEILVNYYNTNSQFGHYIKKLANKGIYIIAWIDYFFSYSRVIYDILYLDRIPYGRFYNDQYRSSVLALSGGNFVIAWTNIEANNTNYVKFKIIDSGEYVIKSETVINDHLGAYNDYYPMLDGFEDGSFVVIWRSTSCSTGSLKGVIYSSSGTVLKALTSLTTCDSAKYGTFSEDYFLTTTSDSRIIISWTQYGQANDASNDVYFQVFDNKFVLLIDKTRVYDGSNLGNQTYLRFCQLSNTSGTKYLFATWTDDSSKDAFNSAIMGRLYSFDLATIIKPDFVINTYQTGYQRNSMCKDIPGIFIIFCVFVIY